MRRAHVIAQSSAGDLGLLGVLASSSRRLAIAAGVGLVLTFGYAGAVARFINDVSARVGLNTALIAGQFLLVALSGYVISMWVSARRYGDAWRRRAFLGERASVVEEEEAHAIGGLRDNTIAFYATALAAAVALYAGVAAVTDDYVQRYNAEGHFRARLRHTDPVERIRSLRSLVDPVRRDAVERPGLRQAVAGAVDDEDAAVRAWACWAAGVLGVQEAAEAVGRALTDTDLDVRVEAARAAGRLRDPIAQRLMEQRLSAGGLSTEDTIATILGLGSIPSTRALPDLVNHARSAAEAVAIAALWAIAQTRTTTARADVWAVWERATGERRCAAADALKWTSVLDDDPRLRVAFSELDRGVSCARRVAPGRSYDDEHQVAPLTLIVGEELRAKYMISSFNIRGPGLYDWLTAIAWSEDESDAVRVRADQLAEALRREPNVPPRVSDGSGVSAGSP